jgi:hypothetical protein
MKLKAEPVLSAAIVLQRLIKIAPDRFTEKSKRTVQLTVKNAVRKLLGGSFSKVMAEA